MRSSFAPIVSDHRSQSGELVVGVDVVLDHVEAEVVEAAEAEDDGEQQEQVGPAEVVEQKGGGRHESRRKKEQGLDQEQSRTLDVTHMGRVIPRQLWNHS